MPADAAIKYFSLLQSMAPTLEILAPFSLSDPCAICTKYREICQISYTTTTRRVYQLTTLPFLQSPLMQTSRHVFQLVIIIVLTVFKTLALLDVSRQPGIATLATTSRNWIDRSEI